MAQPVVVAVSRPLSLAVSTSSGSVKIRAEDRDDLVLERGVRSASQVQTDDDGRVLVEVDGGGSGSLVVRCPAGADLTVGSESGSIKLEGRLGAVRVTGSSGTVRVDHVSEADVRTVSGTVRVRSCDGLARIRSTSGTVRVGRAGEADVTTESGTISLDDVAGRTNARTVSGRVRIGAGGRGDVTAESLSGNVTVRLPRGSDCRVELSSESGRTEVLGRS